jgi:hypothetical protein
MPLKSRSISSFNKEFNQNLTLLLSCYFCFPTEKLSCFDLIYSSSKERKSSNTKNLFTQIFLNKKILFTHSRTLHEFWHKQSRGNRPNKDYTRTAHTQQPTQNHLPTNWRNVEKHIATSTIRIKNFQLMYPVHSLSEHR